MTCPANAAWVDESGASSDTFMATCARAQLYVVNGSYKCNIEFNGPPQQMIK
jgi:hypothetical protein